MREWKETDSYALVQMLLDAEKARYLKELRNEKDADRKTWLQGYLDALDFVINIPERSFIEHNRQVEASHG